MDDRDPNDERYLSARRQARALRAFYMHAMVFVLVNSGLFLIDLLTGDGWWFYWGLIGWGIGLGGHALSVFARVSPFGADWEERKTREIMERERKREES
jgi:fatty acid desaturase